jgi:ammonia channel protein AmtB
MSPDQLFQVNQHQLDIQARAQALNQSSQAQSVQLQYQDRMAERIKDFSVTVTVTLIAALLIYKIISLVTASRERVQIEQAKVELAHHELEHTDE